MKKLPEPMKAKYVENYVYYYEVSIVSLDNDYPEKKGGFLNAPSFTEAMLQLEMYYDSDLLEVLKLKEYYHDIISVPVEISSRWNADYEKEE